MQANIEFFSDPGATALFAPGAKAITFEELSNRTGAVGRRLTEAGVRRGEVVAVMMPDGPELLATIIGVTSAAICAPLNPGLRDTERESHLRAMGARALIGHDDITLLETGSAQKRDAEVALLLQTSATTGRARMVPLTHSNLREMAANTRTILELGPEDRFLSMMPLFHLTGLLSSLAQLMAGGTVIATRGFDAEMFPSWIEEFHPTWYTASPALHNGILTLLEKRPEVLERFPLRFVRSMGAPLDPCLLAHLEKVLHVPVLEGYGMTEAGMVTSNAIHQRKTGSVGKSAGVEVAILGDADTPLPMGRMGEITVRGPAVIRGYWNEGKLTSEWFRSGDVGYLDEDGFLFVTGRVKDIINRGGEKVLPREIDELLTSHPLVSEAVAFGIPHASLGEDVAAAVVVASGVSITETELRRFAADSLADFKVPRKIIILDSIPKGPTGKASRADLAARFQREMSLLAKKGAASTAVENKLEKIWKQILRLKEIDVQDDFFGIGGDSLALMLLLTEIEFEFGIDGAIVENAEFFASPTIKTLAGLIGSAAPASAKRRLPFVVLQPLGSRIPVFCIPGADENPYYFRKLADGLGQDQPFYVLRDPRSHAERGVYTVEEHAAHFCDAIRSVRQSGPYVLGGHCYGGILAFETARQLAAKGEEIGLVALFEVPTPGYPKIARNWRNYLKQSKNLLSVLTRGKETAWSQIRPHARVLQGLVKQKSQALARRGLVGAGLKSRVGQNENTPNRNLGAARTYKPKRLACKVVQFIAADEEHSTLILDDPRLGWRDAVGAGFSIRKVPGGARTLFGEPGVGEIVSQMRVLLDDLDASQKLQSDADVF